MDRNRWELVKSTFDAALERTTAERTGFLREICGDDPELFREVGSLLAAHEHSQNVIEINALKLDAILSANCEKHVGRRFGQYRIISELGRGGMGTVYLAERAEGGFQQKVALKIVRQTIADSELERHFKRERSILADLNHPNIAVLHDGGVSDTGEPFLAMEFIKGDSLLEYSNRLGLREKLELFLKVCSAVEFAHRHLVVHRDIKPTNIMVSEDGVPKLLDFGLAKILDESFAEVEKTQTAFRAFTPAYASPEQVLGKRVTTASDVYSLGVVFFELLTGEKPFRLDGKSLEEIIQTVTNVEPVLPSRTATSSSSRSIVHSEQLKGDLDNIALKALQKEPERRYRSVKEFADDIQRHLGGQPVLARNQTLAYRASRFLRRNKIAATAAAIVILALVSGLTIALWQAEVARTERDRAEKRFNDVRKLSNSLLFEITPSIERLEGSTEARETLVQRALEYLNSLAGESQADDQLRSELASAYEKVGEVQGDPDKPNLSDFSGAISSFEKASLIRRNLPQTPENQSLLARNLHQTARVRYIQNDNNGSLRNSEEALAIYEDLIAGDPRSRELRFALIETRIDHAQTYSANNQYAVAIPLLQTTIASIPQAEREELEGRRLLARAHAFLGNALSWDGRQAEAEVEMEKAVAVCEKLLLDSPNDTNVRQTAWRVYMLASSIYEGTRDELSLQFANRSLDVADKAVRADPADTQAKHNKAKTFSRIGIVSILLKRREMGFRNLENAEDLLRDLVEREPKNQIYQNDLGKLYTRFGDARESQGDLPGALRAFRESASLFEKISLTDEKNMLVRRDLAQSLKSIGKVCLRLKEKENAKQVLQQALDLLDQLKARDALGEYDNRLLVEVRTALREL